MAQLASPFFSIIIPIYNKERYISKCLCSINEQTFCSFEVIIINDGSTDNSQAILDQISDERFHVISINNQGVSNARNIGLDHAKGEYILFIDADDYISVSYLQTIYETLGNDRVDILIFGLQKVYGNNHIRTLIPQFSGKVTNREFIDSYMSAFEKQDGIYGYVCNKTIKRSFISKHNIRFCTDIKQAEDLYFWLDVYKFSPTMAFSQYAEYYYIQNTDNSSAFFKCDPWPQIRIWLKTYNVLSPCNASNLLGIKQKLWDWFEVIFWECTTITLETIADELKKINQLRKDYDFLNDYQPQGFLRKQVKNNNKINIYLYLKARWAYHKLRLWLK